MSKVLLSIALPLPLLLAGCAGAAAIPRSTVPDRASQRPAANIYRSPPATGNAAPGVMGRDAEALTRLLGAPRLTMRDGAATRLQFTSQTCVLDAYLYAPRAGAAAVVSHVDTRTPDGATTDTAACIAGWQRR